MANPVRILCETGSRGPSVEGATKWLPQPRRHRGGDVEPSQGEPASGATAPQTLQLRRRRPAPAATAARTPAGPVRAVSLSVLSCFIPCGSAPAVRARIAQRPGPAAPPRRATKPYSTWRPAVSQVRPQHWRLAAASHSSVCEGFRSLKFRGPLPEVQRSEALLVCFPPGA